MVNRLAVVAQGMERGFCLGLGFDFKLTQCQQTRSHPQIPMSHAVQRVWWSLSQGLFVAVAIAKWGLIRM
ncbi:hypothetical protein, partial [Okeania sp. SIO2G5]|uniref:hypothetical protein n=1 Tax=Okeania sp. SIO2G5 TaxID=2607796 RepID=UPI0013BFAF6B